MQNERQNERQNETLEWKLEQAMEDKSNAFLFRESREQMQSCIRQVLVEELGEVLSTHQIKNYLERLHGYRYLSNTQDLRHGAFLRWISLNEDEPKLKNGAHFCELKTDNEVVLVFKNHHRGTFFRVKMEENIFFQKLTDQQCLLMEAIALF